MTHIVDTLYLAHGICLLWKPWLIGLHLGGDLLIALAYAFIPIAILIFLRRRPDIRFRGVAALFAAFILLCGLTHLVGAVTLWVPIYEIQAGIKVMTAIVSVLTAVAVFALLPKALAIPTAAELERIIAERTRELEEANERLELLTQELAHRSKNLLTVAQSITSQTLRGAGDLDDAIERVDGRLLALAQAIDAAARNRSGGARVRELIDSQLAPYADTFGGRLEIDGPEATIDANTAHYVGLIVHELMTNALKYGALSTDSGSIRLSWEAESGHLDLTWREETPEGAARPTLSSDDARAGFGTLLIDTAGPAAMGGWSERTFASSGMQYRLRIPVAPAAPAAGRDSRIPDGLTGRPALA